MPRVSPAAKARLEGARRMQILAAAARIFARKGFDRATVTEIARAAGLAEGSIYNYFRSKEELLVHIPRQQLDRKSTRLNSSHSSISYAVFCLKKKTKDTVASHSAHIDNEFHYSG